MLLPLRNFVSTSLLTGSQQDRRRSLLKYILFLVGAFSLSFYGIHHPGYDQIINVYGTLGYWLLWGLLCVGLPYALIAHSTLLLSVLYAAYIATHTGGINSPVMVWMTVVLLPAVLLLSARATALWVAIVFLVNSALFWFSRNGVIDSNIQTTDHLMAWAVANKLFVCVVAMYVVYWTERIHSNQVAEVEQSNEELEKTQQALIQAQAHKDEFIASVSHELRTPMNAILGLNGILKNEVSQQPQDVEIVELMRRSTEQLLQLVNDILDFSQLQAGKLKLQNSPFYLHGVLTELLHIYQPKAQAKGLTLTLETGRLDETWVQGDQLRLLQVLRNLLDNALKFTAEGAIQIRAQSVAEGVLLEIEDSGIGIALNRQKQIFNGFEHADLQTNRLYGGSGLGLSICERLVRLQGGTIGVSSVLGRGSRFWLRLPMRPVAMQNNLLTETWVNQLKDRELQILLVDDNAVNLMVARMMLKKCFPNSWVTEATGGKEALEKLKHQKFDLVLMDMVMPHMDGVEATQILRKSFASPVRQIPVLALTASANPVDHDKCLSAGMNDVVQKPFDEKQLISKISAVLLTAQHGEAS